MPCLLLHWLTQCEHEWSPSVPGAVHLLAALQSQHVVTRHLNIVMGIYCCTLNASEIRFCTYSMTLYLLSLLREGGSISCLYGFNLDSHTWLMMISTLSAKSQKCLTIWNNSATLRQLHLAMRWRRYLHCGWDITGCCWFFTVVVQCVQSSQSIYICLT